MHFISSSVWKLISDVTYCEPSRMYNSTQSHMNSSNYCHDAGDDIFAGVILSVCLLKALVEKQCKTFHVIVLTSGTKQLTINNTFRVICISIQQFFFTQLQVSTCVWLTLASWCYYQPFMALGKYMQFQCCLILYAFCHLLHPTLVHTNILAEAIGLLVAYVLEVISCVNFF